MRRVTDDVLAAIGLAQNFAVRDGDTATAAALMNGQERYIIYRPGLFELALAKTGTKWAAYGVAAHEIAHHLLFHTIHAGAGNFEFETASDEWSGFVLAKLGASRDESVAAVTEFAKEFGDSTHPPRAERIHAVQRGWDRGRPERRWDITSVLTFGPDTPPLEYDVVVFKRGGGIRVVDGAKFVLHVSREIVVPEGEALVDGRGRDAPPTARGDWCPNCCGGGCQDWPAGSPKAYSDANDDCSHTLAHHDNGLVRNGNRGGDGATIIITGNRTGNGHLRCRCEGGKGGEGGKRGPGKVHIKPGSGDRWECPGDPHKNDVGSPGEDGRPGTCSCPM